jgi:hypothetical protein
MQVFILISGLQTGSPLLHLPPIQSLEILKRPPSIQINSFDARLFATRGEMGGAALPLNDMPRALPAEHSAHAVEIGDTVRSADHTLAVEDHRADRQRSQGRGDRRELRAPLVTGA